MSPHPYRIATLRARAEIARAGRERRLVLIVAILAALAGWIDGGRDPVIVYPADCYGEETP